MSFREIFRRAFLPMFSGGILSLIFIAFYLNFGNPEAKQILNNQFVERNKKELTEVYMKEKSRLKTTAEVKDLEKDYRKSLQSFNKVQLKNKDVFSLKHFVVYFGIINIFYIIISIFFGAFLRKRESQV